VGKAIRKVEEPADEIKAFIPSAEPDFMIGSLTFGVGWGLRLLVFLERFSMVVMGGHGEGLQRPCGDQPEMSVRRGQLKASE
jgi:hypothetical protein